LSRTGGRYAAHGLLIVGGDDVLRPVRLRADGLAR
jgi:hypothetical protein